MTPTPEHQADEPEFRTLLEDQNRVEVTHADDEPLPENLSTGSTRTVASRSNATPKTRSQGTLAGRADSNEREAEALLVIHQFEQLNGTGPTLKALEKRVSFGRTLLTTTIASLHEKKHVKKLIAGTSKIVNLTPLGRSRAEAIQNTQQPSTETPPEQEGQTTATRLTVSDERGQKPLSRDALEAGEAWGGVPPAEPVRLGAGSPLGSGVRKHRLKYKSRFVWTGTEEELGASLTNGGWVDQPFKNVRRFGLSKAGHDVAVQVLWRPGQEGGVRGSVLWAPGDVFAASVEDAEFLVLEALRVKSGEVEELVPRALGVARERARDAGDRRGGLWFSRAPKFRVLAVERVSVELWSDERRGWAPFQGEVAVTDNEMVRHFRGEGVRQAWVGDMGFDGSKGGNELEWRGRDAAADSLEWLSRQQDLFVRGGYDRDQARVRGELGGLRESVGELELGRARALREEAVWRAREAESRVVDGGLLREELRLVVQALQASAVVQGVALQQEQGRGVREREDVGLRGEVVELRRHVLHLAGLMEAVLRRGRVDDDPAVM